MRRVKFQTLSPRPWRKSKATSALVLKIDKDLKIVQDALLTETTLDEIRDELPDNTPRFVLISFEMNHKDGRVSYPLVGLYYHPSSASTAQKMLYASSCSALFQKAQVVGKVFDLTNAEGLTETWLIEQIESSKTRP